MTYKDGDVTSYVSPKIFFYFVCLRFWGDLWLDWIGFGWDWVCEWVWEHYDDFLLFRF